MRDWSGSRSGCFGRRHLAGGGAEKVGERGVGLGVPSFCARCCDKCRCDDFQRKGELGVIWDSDCGGGARDESELELAPWEYDFPLLEQRSDFRCGKHDSGVAREDGKCIAMPFRPSGGDLDEE